MKKIVCGLIVIIFSYNDLYSQGITNNWILGYQSYAGPPTGHTTIDFFSGIPIINPDSLEMDIFRTAANISDTAGNLLFYTNGYYIAESNSSDTLMARVILEKVKGDLLDRFPEEIQEGGRLATPNQNLNAETNSGYYLGDNRPNPFTDFTSIDIFIPDNFIQPSLIISNAYGQKVVVRKLVSGENTLEFSKAELDYGVFFYSLFNESSKIQTKRMVIIH